MLDTVEVYFNGDLLCHFVKELKTFVAIHRFLKSNSKMLNFKHYLAALFGITDLI